MIYVWAMEQKHRKVGKSYKLMIYVWAMQQKHRKVGKSYKLMIYVWAMEQKHRKVESHTNNDLCLGHGTET